MSLLNKEKVFLFIGSEKAYKELNKFINNTHKNKLIYFDNINRIYEYENLKKKIIIITENKSYFKSPLIKQSFLINKKISLYNNIDFQEKFLFRIQPELIDVYLERNRNTTYFYLNFSSLN